MRSSAGKTTLAGRLAATIPACVVVHTDDIAWHHAVLDWVDLLVGGVLEPARRGESVRDRPPQWDQRDRPGAIVVPASTRVLVVEGVGASRRELAPLLDAAVWVQSDAAELERRNRSRVAAEEMSPADFASWMAQEDPFLLADRAWERATAIVAGTPVLPHDPTAEVVMGGRG